MPRIHILLPDLARYDAIGNDVLGMASAADAAGYAVEVHAGSFDECYAGLPNLRRLGDGPFRSSPADLIVYHHSMGWPEGEEVLRCAVSRTVIRYHNVTPPEYFASFAESFVEACRRGIESTKRLVALSGGTVYWGDSWFNCEQLITFGAPRSMCRVLPPFHVVECLGAEPIDYQILSEFRDGKTNVLFVGGFKPNKGHARAIRAFAVYQQYMNRESRLVFAGNFDQRLESYVDGLRQIARELGIRDEDLRLLFSATSSQLRTCYMVADVFLCTSEHEGFCVPLVEAMYLRVPVVAWGTTAVPETLADAGLVSPQCNEYWLAEAIHAVVENPTLARALTERGRRRYRDTFSPGVLQQRLGELVQEALGQRAMASP